jgi:hypothetical protein
MDYKCSDDDCRVDDVTDLLQRGTQLHTKVGSPTSIRGQQSHQPVQHGEESFLGLGTHLRDAAAPSLAQVDKASIFSSADAKPQLFQRTTGEFHNPTVSKVPATDSFKKLQCQNFYKVSGFIKNMQHDPVSGLFRPSEEIDTAALFSANQIVKENSDGELHAGGSMAPRKVKRVFTYEDVAFPKGFHKPSKVSTWCEMYAVRTPQRPVKMITAYSACPKNNCTLAQHSLAMPAIWKVATTSLTSMLSRASGKGPSTGPNESRDSWCNSKNRLPQCYKHTSFVDDARNAKVKAAVIRSPLDRFLASVYEHGHWDLCKGKVCDDEVAKAKELALKMATGFPHEHRICEMPTQTYFLSATDTEGEPYEWDQIVRLENFEDGIKTLNRASGLDLAAYHENTSGDKKTKQMYFDAVFSDLKTLCSVCKVYQQDFECLGYAMPDRCTKAKCAKVGVSLTRENPEVDTVVEVKAPEEPDNQEVVKKSDNPYEEVVTVKVQMP